jgi:hypothetical protein
LIRALTGFVLQFDVFDAERFPVWEPGAGEGNIANAIAATGYRIIATDLVPRRTGIARLDFLHDEPPAATRDAMLVANPPFREPLLDLFISRALALLDRDWLQSVILLMRIDHLTAAGRAAAFNRAAETWTCCWRPRWIPGSAGNGRWSFVWVVWSRCGAQPPVSRYLTLADLRQPELPLPALGAE